MNDLYFEDLDNYLIKQKGKIIHQIWFGIIPNKSAAKKCFLNLKKFRDSWLVKNPDWTYITWNLDNCNNLVKTHYTEHLNLYKNYPYHIQRCDVVRYFILHRYGGWYADMDYYCNRPLNEVHEKFIKDFYLVETPNKFENQVHVSNSLMYSKSGHVFWKRLFIELEKCSSVPYYYSRHLEIMFTTGPGILNRVYNEVKLRDHLDYLPYKLFHPHGLSSDLKSLCKNTDVYAVHIGKGSWENNDSKFIIFMYQEWKILLFIIMIICISLF